MSALITVGIDPGLTGAIAWLSPISPKGEVRDMPANPADVVDLLREIAGQGRCEAVIEQAQAMPKQGVASTFGYGRGYGVLLGALAALAIPYTEVRPGVWKRAMGLTGKDKEASRALARSLWPLAPLGRVRDHGRAEALLLAEWGRRRGAGVGR